MDILEDYQIVFDGGVHTVGNAFVKFTQHYAKERDTALEENKILKEKLKDSEHERECLEYYIRDAAVHTGVYKPDTEFSFPLCLKACVDITNYCLELKAELDRVKNNLEACEGDNLKLKEFIDVLESDGDKFKSQLQASESRFNSKMGVGNGFGSLFVYGNYDSIKAMQEIIIEKERLQAIVTSWERDETEQEEFERVSNEIGAQLYEEMQDAIDPYVEARLLPHSVIESWGVIFKYWKTGIGFLGA